MRAWAVVCGWAERLATETADRLRRRGRSAALRALRLTGAAVAGYIVAHALSPGTQPVLAPLTALLVVQVTLFGSVRSSIQRVASVVAGVLLAVLFSQVVGISWWSLGAIIALSIVIGQLLRLGDHLLEVPISAMLVLAVGGGEAAAADRIRESLIGAATGILVNVAFPPAVQTRSAGAAVEEFAGRMAQLLDSAAADMADGASAEQAARWLEDARRISRHVPRVDRALDQAEESRRLNVRALGTPDTAASLRGGLDALEHCAAALRSLFRSILDGIRATPDRPGDYADEVRLAFATLLRDLAAAVRAFGHLVHAEAQASAAYEEAELVEALEALREARVRVTELLLVDPREDLVLWELNSSLLATVERVLRELDVEEHVRLRERLRREAAALRLGGQAAARVRSTTRQIVERPRRRRTDERAR